jgi:fumarate reductase subunit C
LPEAPFADRVDRRAEARHDESGAPGGALSARAETWAWIVQRAAAVVLAIAVTVHLVTIIYAVRSGLSAAAILGRIEGNAAWLAFYAAFALAAALHGAHGLRTVAREWTPWRGRSLDFAAVLAAALLAAAGCRAAWALYAA